MASAAMAEMDILGSMFVFMVNIYVCYSTLTLDNLFDAKNVTGNPLLFLPTTPRSTVKPLILVA
jgi:hypothetical protein